MVIINCCVGILLLLMIQDEKRDRALVRDVLIPYPSPEESGRDMAICYRIESGWGEIEGSGVPLQHLLTHPSPDPTPPNQPHRCGKPILWCISYGRADSEGAVW